MILLDTHALIWWVEDSGRLSDAASHAINQEAPVLISPISFWEVTLLIERGRIALDRDINRWCRDLLASERVRIAPFTPTAAILAGRLPGFHGDPADRFMYATARELGVRFVSKDERIGAYARRHGDLEVVW